MSQPIRSILTRITLTTAAILLVPYAALACPGHGLSAEESEGETRSNLTLRVEKDGVVVEEIHSQDGLIGGFSPGMDLEGSLLELVQKMVAETMAQNLRDQEKIREDSGLKALEMLPEDETSTDAIWERRARGERPQKRTFIYKRGDQDIDQDIDQPIFLRPRSPELRFVSGSTDVAVSQPVMTRGRLARILASLDDEPFSEDQLEILLEIAGHFQMTTDQASKLVDQLAFSEDRLEALAALYPSILDPENFSDVYELLDFASDRKKLRKRIQAL
ncbi:MAG: DUF4476 domain-containing protein [Myxococcota bacterium]|nr:DUF4476 domain-containing protein [Myxococcota bacterium]